MKTLAAVVVLGVMQSAPAVPHHDYVLWGFVINLVLTIATACIAIYSVIQAKAARDNAEAAKVSADVLWASQRAQLVAEPHGYVAGDLMSKTPRVQLTLTNKGMTPAHSVNWETWIEIVPASSEDFTDAATHSRAAQEITLYPGVTITVNIPLGRNLTDLERDQIKALNLRVYVRLKAEYRDARQASRYADFGYWVMNEGLGFLAQYTKAN